jgi:hypothetical protein
VTFEPEKPSSSKKYMIRENSLAKPKKQKIISKTLNNKVKVGVNL